MDLETAIHEIVQRMVRDEVRRALADATRPAEYLACSEAARIASVAPGTIRRWIRAGRLRGHRAGRHVRVARADLEALLKAEPQELDLSPEELAIRDFG